MGQENLQSVAGIIENALLAQGITHIFIDVDDTLLQTAETYHFFMKIAAQKLAQVSGKTAEEIFDLQNQSDRQLRPHFNVDPQIMIAIITDVFLNQLHLTDKELLTEIQQDMLKIFQAVPELCDGVEAAAQILSCFKTIIPVAWTHATQDWTEHKLSAHPQLKNLFQDNIYCVPVGGHKDLIGYLQEHQIDPKHVLVIGNSLQSDVLVAFESGVPPENILYIDSIVTIGNQGELPHGVNAHPNIYEALCSLANPNTTF